MDRAMRTQKRYSSVFGRKLRLLQPERIIVTDIRARMPYKGSKRAAADFFAPSKVDGYGCASSKISWCAKLM